MSLENLYYKRTAATPKACYICYKPTPVVLATIDTSDFLYTCPIHLTDPGFATRIQDPVPKVAAGGDEIAKVKQEWEVKQKRKEKEKEKEKDKDSDENEKKDKQESDDRKKARDTRAQDVVQAPASEQPTPAPKPTHERYILHRDIFSLRVDNQRRQRQGAAAKTLIPRLPGVPGGRNATVHRSP